MNKVVTAKKEIKTTQKLLLSPHRWAAQCDPDTIHEIPPPPNQENKEWGGGRERRLLPLTEFSKYQLRDSHRYLFLCGKDPVPSGVFG